MNMKSKQYRVTVMTNAGNRLEWAKGRSGLKALVESLGLSFGGLRETYADRGVESQVHVEYSEAR